MLTLLVGSGKETVITTDGKKMRVCTLLTQEGGKLRCFQDRIDYADVEDVEILTAKWSLLLGTVRLTLTPGIKKSIVRFLHCYHARQDMSFDCYSFATLVQGLKPHSKACLGNWWNFRKLRWLPRVGDTLFLFKEERGHFLHAAIYIGRGFYLSVYGAGGDLEVATLQDMKKGYKTNRVVRVTIRT